MAKSPQVNVVKSDPNAIRITRLMPGFLYPRADAVTGDDVRMFSSEDELKDDDCLCDDCDDDLKDDC